MRHGNEKEEFETGAQRDIGKGKGKPSLISPVLIHRTSVHLAAAEEHYPPKDGSANWMKGMSFRRTADSIIRHIFQWLAGDEEEDHLAALACNTMFLMHFEEAIKAGQLPTLLDDRDKGLKKILPSILTSAPPDATLETREGKIVAFDPSFEAVCPVCRNNIINQEDMMCKACLLIDSYVATRGRDYGSR